MKRVLSSNPYDVPANDLYGRLYFYIVDKMTEFVALIKTKKLKFHMFCADAKDLMPKLRGIKFDRIDVSNISDENYVGLDCVIKLSKPLLNNANSNAKLITTLMNWTAGTDYGQLINAGGSKLSLKNRHSSKSSE